MADPQERERSGTATPEDRDRIRPARLTVEVGAIAALLLLFNLWPQWVGCFVRTGAPQSEWRFLPLLEADFTGYLLGPNLWWGLALVLKLVLLKQGRWRSATRWANAALGFFGAYVLFWLATRAPIVGLNPEWMTWHGWPDELWATQEEGIALVSTVTRIVLLATSLGVAIAAAVSLSSVGPGWKALTRFVREGMAGRNLPEILDLFRNDASRAYQVLDRDQELGPEPEGWIRRVSHRAKVLFFGVSRQLSPARRLLFAACIVLALFNALITPTSWSLAPTAGLLLLLLLELVDRVRIRDELQVARHLQRDLLPAASPELPGYTVVHSYRTANEIGGDYYDFLAAADSRTAIVVGDASGHGMAAGLLMAIANATLKAAVDLDPDPEVVLTHLNRALVRTGDRRAFMTIFYGLLSPASGRLDFVCAGHPYPLLRRAAGEVVELGAGSLPLGIREGLDSATESITIEPGDRLILYSDGLPEAMNKPDGEAFSFGRLRDLAAAAGRPGEIHDRILRAFDAHVGDEPLADDLTLVVLGRE